MRNYPAEFYAKDKKPLHVFGYTVSLAMMAVGVFETLHGVSHNMLYIAMNYCGKIF